MNLSRPFEDLLGNNTAQILRRLAMLSGELSGRRIASLSGVPPVSAARVLTHLVEIGLVSARYVGQSREYQLNREHVLWQSLQAMLNSAEAIESRIAEIAAKCAPPGTTVAVFGSFARGEAGPASDIDLAIVSTDRADPDERFVLADLLKEEVSLMTGNSVDIVDIVDEDLDGLVTASDALVQSWMKDARTLHGTDLRSRIRRMDVPV